MRPAAIASGPKAMLCADDYGISPAVSAGIEHLSIAGRLSATSCMVTFAEWPDLARRLAGLRGRIAIGLHLNLTTGAPLGPMPVLAPTGSFPAIDTVIAKAMRGAIDPTEIAVETTRQLEAFAEHAGFAPDFLDGHQHVHSLPRLRHGVLQALTIFAAGRPMLVRDPSDRLARILRRRMSVPKSNMISALAMGFAGALRSAGFLCNDGFSGVSRFDPAVPYAAEIEAAFTACGPRHLAMCHPGHVDAVLATRDAVTTRREDELATLLNAEGLTERLWRPDRSAACIWGRDDG